MDNQFNQTGSPQQTKAYGIASMICGILSLLCCCCSSWLPIVLGVVAIVLFVLEKILVKKTTGFAIAGLVCGIITVIIVALSLIFVGILESSGAFEMFESIMSEYGIDMSSMMEL